VVLITGLRAVLAFGIGVALLLIPERGEAALTGFMGTYFLVSGLFSLAWARRGPILRRLALVAGVVGVATGAVVLTYAVAGRADQPPELVVKGLGLAIGLTGTLHLAGGFVIGERIDRWPTGHLLLGTVEIALAAILLAASARLELIYGLATMWAFTAGSVLAFDAVRSHRRWSIRPTMAPVSTRSMPGPDRDRATDGD